jgi:hypothetical protein
MSYYPNFIMRFACLGSYLPCFIIFIEFSSKVPLSWYLILGDKKPTFSCFHVSGTLRSSINPMKITGSTFHWREDPEISRHEREAGHDAQDGAHGMTPTPDRAMGAQRSLG